MKKSIFALAAIAAMAMSASTYATTYNPVVTGSGSNTVYSSTGVGVTSTAGSYSKGSATNTQSAASWAGGGGSYGGVTATKTLTLEDCAPTNYTGTLTTGKVDSFGGVAVSGKSTASVVGTGTAQGVGYSEANAAGKTVLTSPKFNLEAGGTAGALVQTDTGVVTSGAASSAGATGAGWTSSQVGTLFNYTGANGVIGDVKKIDSAANGYAGATLTYTAGNACQPGKCVMTPAFTSGPLTVVNAGSSAYTNGSVKNTFGN